jgi:hypothetical protein
VGVFLRWGIFGIIAVAALVYAYNALGHLADRHKASPAAVVASPTREPGNVPAREPDHMPRDAGQAAAQDERDAIPQRCVVELDIARRAVESRSVGEPLDRLLRIQEIAWQKDDKLRARYAQLATHWYEEPGPVDAARLRRDVFSACIAATP